LRKQRLHAFVGGPERLGKRAAEPLERALLARLHRERRALDDRRRPPLRRAEEVRCRHHLVHQPHPQRLGGRDRLAGEDHAHRDLERDVPGKPMHPARGGHEPDARLGQPEGRMLGGHDDVARERDLEAAAEREAVDGRDDGLPEVEAGRDAAEAALRQPRHPVARRPLEVVAGREGPVACPRENRHTQLVVGRERIPGAGELLVGIGVQRVEDLGAVDRDRDHVLPLLVADELERHAALLAPAPRRYQPVGAEAMSLMPWQSATASQATFAGRGDRIYAW
jgi:hypothetical protein